MTTSARLPCILIVDDNPDELFLTQRALRKAGVRNPIATATGGAAAIEHLRTSCLAGGGNRLNKPAVLFVDIKMPAVDGFKVIKWARKKRAYRKLKIFVLTNSDEPRDVNLAKQLRVDGYLVKYPTPSILAWLMRQALAPASPGKVAAESAPVIVTNSSLAAVSSARDSGARTKRADR
jgi:two-component system response regulator